MRWKQLSSTTDSSVEQGLEVGCSATDLAGTTHQQWTSDRSGEPSLSSKTTSVVDGCCSECSSLGRCGLDPRLASDSRTRDFRVERAASGGLRAAVSGLPLGSRGREVQGETCFGRFDPKTTGGSAAGTERSGLGGRAHPGRDARPRVNPPSGGPGTSVSAAIPRRGETSPRHRLRAAAERAETAGGQEAAVTRYGCRRGNLRRVRAASREIRAGCRPPSGGLALHGGNAANLMAGSGTQQARSTQVEQADKTVRNREVGT